MFPIRNKTFNGKWYRKYLWYIYFEIAYFFFRFSKSKYIHIDVTFEDFHVTRNEAKIFYLARYIAEAIMENNKNTP
jgi:hypothetical protein